MAVLLIFLLFLFFFFFFSSPGSSPNWFEKSPCRTKPCILQACCKDLVDFLGAQSGSWSWGSIQQGISILWPKRKALVALTLCQQLSKCPFIAEADCQLLYDLWDAVLCHSWFLWAAGRALGHLPPPCLPPPGSATLPFLRQRWQGWDSALLRQISYREAENIKALPKDSQLCLGSCDLVNLKPKIHPCSSGTSCSGSLFF